MTQVGMERKRGRFIVIEGLDGAGSSTQVLALQRFLVSRGIRCEMTKEPSDGPFGAVIREAINKRIPIAPRALALAFAADRADHLYHITIEQQKDEVQDTDWNKGKWEAREAGIKILLEQGIWVICDRYVLSNLAYQSAQGLDLDWLIEINKGVITPDATIFIRTPLDECFRRLKYRSSHLELFDNPGQLKSVSERYARIIYLGRKELIGHYVEVDGTAFPEVVTKSIISELSRYFTEELTRAEVSMSTLAHQPEIDR